MSTLAHRTAVVPPRPLSIPLFTTAVQSDSALHRWRRALTAVLGVLWLLDAALQFQPYMFTRAFPTEEIAPAGQGSPHWVSGPVSWAAQLLAGHVIVFNGLFALVQLMIAIGLFVRPTIRLALVASVAWAGMVWWMGEGLGGVFSGPVSALDGLPGAVVVYALIAVLLWPTVTEESGSVAAASPLRRVGSTALWLVFWGFFAVETLWPANRAANAPHDMVAGMAAGEPQWIKAIDNGAARALAGHGLAVAVVLAMVFGLVALAVFVPALLRPAVVVAVVVAAAIWVVAENFGEIATGQATDPNTGPLLALFALCYWPVRNGVRFGRVRPGRSE